MKQIRFYLIFIAACLTGFLIADWIGWKIVWLFHDSDWVLKNMTAEAERFFDQMINCIGMLFFGGWAAMWQGHNAIAEIEFIEQQ